MDELKENRQKIDRIDEQIRDLFIERMKIVESIASMKLANDLSVYDHSREEEIIAKNLEKVNDSEFKEYYQELLTTILKVSKDFQKLLIFRSTL